MKHTVAAIFLLFATLTLASHTALSAAEAPPLLFEPAVAAVPDGRDSAAVRVDLTLLQADPDSLQLTLPDGRSLTAERSGWSWQSADHYSWFGTVDTAADGRASLPGMVSLFYRSGRLFGEIQLPGGAFYELVPDGDLHRVAEVPSSPSAPCATGHRNTAAAHGTGTPDSIARALLGGSDSECAIPPSTVEIDLLVLYPRSLYLLPPTVEDFVTSRTAQANLIFTLSQVNVRYNLVHIGLITGEQPPDPPTLEPGDDPDSVEAPTSSTLAWLNDQFATAPLDTEVELLRAAHGADMIAIIVPPFPNRNCGIANLPELEDGVEVLPLTGEPFGDKAFMAMELNCGNHDLTFAHELGHTFGMRHDGTPNAVDILPWAYGFIVISPKDTVATVMACVDPETPVCSRVGRFSNPDLLVGGVPAGLHSSQSATPAHNACVANLRAEQYRDFVDPPPTSPPSLAIDAPGNGTTVYPATAFNLIADASDPEDGDLSASVTWQSDREGFLGTGSPLSTSLAIPGPHLITASVTDSSGTRLISIIRLNVWDQDPPRRHIDVPLVNQQVSGDAQVYGWATDASGVVEVRYELDGAPAPGLFDEFIYGGERPDVCAAHSDLNDPNCPEVGFGGWLDTRSLTNGSHTLTVTFVDLHGNASSVSRNFRTENTSTEDPSAMADAWVSEAAPTTNFGTGTFLDLRALGSGDARHAYIKFELSGITRPVQSAILKIWSDMVPIEQLEVYGILDSSWGESTLTWNNAPLEHDISIAAGDHPSFALIEIDVTSMVTGDGTYTFGLVAKDKPNQRIYSRQTPTRAPVLSVTY